MEFNINFYTKVLLCMLLFAECMGDEKNYQSHISRKIDSLGFHRNIYYNFSLKTSHDMGLCKLCLQETLPSGVFVNKDQLQDFLRLGKLAASVDGIVDVESPENVSPQIIVQILTNLNVTSENFLGSATLPIHMRYHNPQPGGGFKKVIINKPELYLHCDGDGSHVKGEVYLTPCAGYNSSPVPFYKIPFSIDSEDAVLSIEVPVGDSNSLPLVQVATLFVTGVGSFYIASLIIKK